MSKRIWTTRHGKEIAYEDLETDHLCSIIAMLERNAEKFIKALSPTGALTVEDVYPSINPLRAEMALRLAKLEAKKVDDEQSDSAQRFALLELD